MGNLKIISEVVANHLCTGCGTCVGICAAAALEMRETPGGQIVPRLMDGKCNDCGLCDMVCPQIELSNAYREVLSQPLLGILRCGYLAEAAEPDVADQGQTGGFIRALLAWALQTKRVDGVVCVTDDLENPLRPKPVVVTNPVDVLACSRSKYCPIPVNRIILEMIKFKGKLAYVGLPCQIQGLQLVTDRIAALQNKLQIRIGLFCDRVLNYHAVDFLARCSGVRSTSDIEQFDYRHKAWRGWPGDIRVVTRHGEVQNTPLYRRTMSRGVFTCTHCLLCPDKLNVLADLSVGDPHGVCHGQRVPSAVLVRTEAGEHLIQAAESAGVVKMTSVDPKQVAEGQRVDRRCRIELQCARQMQHRGFRLPVFLRSGPLAVSPAIRRSLYSRVAIWWGIRSQSSSGIWLMRHLPTWTPLLWRLWVVTIRGNWRRGIGLIKRKKAACIRWLTPRSWLDAT